MFKNFFFIAWPAIGMIDTKKGYNISTIRRDGKKKKKEKKDLYTSLKQRRENGPQQSSRAAQMDTQP